MSLDVDQTSINAAPTPPLPPSPPPLLFSKLSQGGIKVWPSLSLFVSLFENNQVCVQLQLVEERNARTHSVGGLHQ